MAKGGASSPPPDHEKTFSEKKIPGHEIEEIFASKKKRKKKESADSPVEDKKGGQKKMRKKKMKEKCKSKTTSSKSDEFSDLPSRPRRQTQEGLTIYTAVELGIGKSNAGGTPLCPFDCSCCFWLGSMTNFGFLGSGCCWFGPENFGFWVIEGLFGLCWIIGESSGILPSFWGNLG